MTEMLYMADAEANYIKEFEAVVQESAEDYVVLDRTAFYPVGGGQPSDTGVLRWDGGEARVIEVTKKGGVKHHLEGDRPPVGARVTGVLDWERRYGHMRMHTAQHIVSGIVYDEFGARTVGNQLYADRSRIDFQPVKFTDEDLAKIEKMANEMIGRHYPVEIREIERGELEKMVKPERCNLELLPKSVRNLRVVFIGDADICPCAGTHVRNTSELGHVRILKKENKGKQRMRISYVLEG